MAAEPAGTVPPSALALDDRTDAFDRFSLALVRLEPCALDVLRDRVEEFARELEGHLLSGPARGTPHAERLTAEHARFRDSVAELRSLLRVVERDDHGGHRQALGQYGRILAEALRRHRSDELADAPSGGSRTAPARAP